MVKSGDEITNPRTGQRMRFLKTSRDTNGELLQIDCFNPPSGVKEPEHIHPYQESRFEVRSGMLSISIAGAQRQARAGEVVSIPAGVPHYFWNAGPQDAYYVQEFRPALRIELFFETLFALARNGQLNEQGLPSLLQMAVLVPSFWSEIRVTRPPQFIQQAMFALLGPVSRSLGYRGV